MSLEVYVIEKIEARLDQLQRRLENLEIKAANVDECITAGDLGRTISKLHPEINDIDNWWDDIWS